MVHWSHVCLYGTFFFSKDLQKGAIFYNEANEKCFEASDKGLFTGNAILMLVVAGISLLIAGLAVTAIQEKSE